MDELSKMNYNIEPENALLIQSGGYLMFDHKKVLIELRTLVIFREIQEDPVMRSLENFCVALQVREGAQEAYSVFLHHLYQKGGDLGNHLLHLVINSENFYVRQKGLHIDTEIKKCLDWELNIFQSWSQWKPSSLILEMKIAGVKELRFFPSFHNTSHSFASRFYTRMQEIETAGYGIFSQYTMFQLWEHQLRPIRNPDTQSLASLVGYEKERSKLLANTQSFLAGKSATNALLYGDAGTGKSSTIKALVNEYHPQGLRLIEIKKRQLDAIPELMDTLSENPLKFIIFIDDLTFSRYDENFGSLKSLLEGGASAQNRNVLIYATSNRRHLVRETMEERQGTEIHESDTIQDTIGLASRFGLTVTFQRPNRKAYLEIVAHYAKEYDLFMDPEEMKNSAEAYALRSGGRSPRAAKQFVQLEKGLS